MRQLAVTFAEAISSERGPILSLKLHILSPHYPHHQTPHPALTPLALTPHSTLTTHLTRTHPALIPPLAALSTSQFFSVLIVLTADPEATAPLRSPALPSPTLASRSWPLTGMSRWVHIAPSFSPLWPYSYHSLSQLSSLPFPA